MRIPVVFATDEKYLFYMCVAITSMAQSANAGTTYQVYVLTSKDFVDTCQMLDKVQGMYNNIQVTIITVETEIFQNAVIHNSHVTKATFYRLVLCDLITEDKCIYLDGDIIVTEDLGELYHIDLEENYLAGCRDIWIDLLPEDMREERRKRVGLLSMDEYVNAGVLLLNLKRLRDDGMGKIFIKYMQNSYPYEDQDVLNICCYGRIVHLPAKWNLFTFFMGQIDQMQQAGIDKTVIEAYQKKSGNFHYATPFIRPWEKEFCWMNKEWWQVAEVWENISVFQEIKRKVQEKEKEYKWDYFEELCIKYSNIVIFGYTKCGRELCDWIRKIEAVDTIVFCDNNIKKQGEVYKGIQVFSFHQVLKRYENGQKDMLLFIIVSQNRAGEIQEFLAAHEIPESRRVTYRQKDSDYYLYLDKRYYMRELQEICKKEGKDWKNFCHLELKEIQGKLQNDSAFQEWISRYHMKNWLLREEAWQ